ncbi:hypothetical protein CC1G_06912 [Coprinopsis cinerea okayama7|uniref:SigF-like NTF2-like domain-containing protein n=1 Tax=Coprinopsis cinerea (strain Okayama-7 / 130 / ATCC MYA-4618 / FGSC 9003) TaxID=240176 RepID=A8NZM8_COPC7|nr:hypothetical protein CC1G_06912 [Coprinopsis cinerea okayama7\|eukprot:XP_001837706.2 hypothetical protein CC1G_06912 [Coprinopsis cinerea okayama7\
MENPPQDIHKVFDLVDSVYSPDLQKAAIEKFFLPEAGFRYPVYAIEPGPGSRDKILGVYQWLHIISPRTRGVIHHVCYDKGKDMLYLDVTQHLHLLYLPFMASKSRMVTRLTLKKQSGLHYIAMQEDFMQPDDIAGLLFPPIKRAVHFVLVLMAVLLCYLAKIAQYMGFFPVSMKSEGDLKTKRKDRKRGRKNGNNQNTGSSQEQGSSSKDSDFPPLGADGDQDKRKRRQADPTPSEASTAKD